MHLPPGEKTLEYTGTITASFVWQPDTNEPPPDSVLIDHTGKMDIYGDDGNMQVGYANKYPSNFRRRFLIKDPGASFDVTWTPTIYAHALTGEAMLKMSSSIRANGLNLNISGTKGPRDTPRALVGQRVGGNLAFVGGGFYVDMPTDQHIQPTAKFTVGAARAYKSYAQYTTATELIPVEENQDSIGFFIAAPIDEGTTVKATFKLIDEPEEYSLSRKVYIDGPTITEKKCVLRTPTYRIVGTGLGSFRNEGPTDEFYDASGKKGFTIAGYIYTNVVKFDPMYGDADSGSFFYTQLVTPFQKITFADNWWYGQKDNFGVEGLDAVIQAPAKVKTGASPKSYIDAPGFTSFPLDVKHDYVLNGQNFSSPAVTVDIRADFIMYVMFVPPAVSGGSFPVPLRRKKWNSRGVLLRQQDGTWYVSSNLSDQPILPPGKLDWPEFPEWTVFHPFDAEGAYHPPQP